MQPRHWPVTLAATTKSAFSRDSQLQRALEARDMPLVGRLLKGYIIDALTSQTVLEMLRNGEVGKLRAILESSKEAEELHGKWERLS